MGLHYACAGGHVSVVEYLLGRGADIHAVTEVRCVYVYIYSVDLCVGVHVHVVLVMV